MKTKGSLIFTSFLLLVFAAVIARSLTFGHWQSMLFPILIGGSCFLLLGIKLAVELSTKNGQTTEEQPDCQTGAATEEQPDVQTGGASFANVMAWLSAFAVGIYLFGFLIAIVLFVFSYLKVRRRSWWVSAVTAVMTVIVLYCIFKFGLDLDLYGGLISQFIGVSED